MAAGVLIDTSFLITLADKNRTNHATARRYWQHFLENQIPIFLPTILFALGSQLLVLGLLMLLFSNNGILTLKWDAKLWFLYAFAACPCLYFGYRAILKL